MFTQPTKISKLQDKSSKILNVFTSTLQELTVVDTEIQEEIKVKELELSQLNTLQTNNNKILNKINSFIND